MSATYSIQQLSREFGVTARTLRFYEDKGLLAPERRGSTRRYSDRDRVRLRLTLRGKRLGFSLDECLEIIDLYDPTQPNNQYQYVTLLDRIRAHRADLLQKLADIEATLRAMDDVEQKCLAGMASASSQSGRGRKSMTGTSTTG
ncbi:MAG: MerR family transcriptional regulator [Gammaproteobacteria bacterium]